MAKLAVDEQDPLFGEGHTSYAKSTDELKKSAAKPGVDITTLIVLTQGKNPIRLCYSSFLLRSKLFIGAFWALACESFVISTHDDIASFFNHLSMGPWMLTAYSMGYCIMLPLVSLVFSHVEQKVGN